MTSESVTSRNVEYYIDRRLAKIKITRSMKSRKLPPGILSLLYPLKYEMNASKNLILSVRQAEMKRLFRVEHIGMNDELKAKGLSLQQTDNT